MTIGFDDLSSTRRVPDRDVKKTIKPIYKVMDFGDGYESRISIGTDGREESYSLTFNNRPADEITNIIGFFQNRAKDKTFLFTIPDTTQPGGERDIVVYCDTYSATYVNKDIASLSAKFIRVQEIVSGTSQVIITTQSLLMTEGDTLLVQVSSYERGPENLYWTLDGANLQDFQDIDGAFATSGTTTLSTGSFSISTLDDVTTEGPEQYTLSIRSGSVGGPVLDTAIVTVQDTSVGPETFNLQDNLGNNLINAYVLQQTSITVYVSVQNYAVTNPLYYTIAGGEGVFGTSQGVIFLSGTFANSTASFTINAPATSVDLLNAVQLRKDSVTGAIVDSLNLNTLVAEGAEITDSNYTPVDFLGLGPNDSPAYEVTAYFKGTLFPIEQIYWTIDNATAGVDFTQVQGTFLPTGDDNFNFGSFTITKPVPSPEVVEYFTLSIRSGGYTGTILDQIDLVVETSGLLQYNTIDTVDYLGDYIKNEGSISIVYQTIISTEQVDTLDYLGSYAKNYGTIQKQFQELGVIKQIDTLDYLGSYAKNYGTIQRQFNNLSSTEQIDTVDYLGSYTKNSGSITIMRT